MAMVCQRRAPWVVVRASASLTPIRAAWKRRAKRAVAQGSPGRMRAPAGARARKWKSLEKPINKGNRPYPELKSRCAITVAHLSGRFIVRNYHRTARTSYMAVNLPTPQYSTTCTIGQSYPSHVSCSRYSLYTSNHSYSKHLVFK